VAVLGASLLLSTSAIAPGAVAARDWSPYIASLRSSQLYYESVMRSADIQIRSIERSVKKTKRAVKRAEQGLERKRDRHDQRQARLSSARLRLALARARLEAASVAPPALQDLSAALRSATVSALSSAATSDRAAPLAYPPVPDPALDEMSPADLADESHAYVEAVLAAQAAFDLDAGEVRRAERSAQRSRRLLARAARHERRLERRVTALKRARRGAIARREGAEGGLGSAILGMSRYAQRRIAKQTKVRPGITSSFIWPTRGRLSQGYGRGHDGIDIAGYRGTPIRAAAIGVVSYVGWNPWDQHGRAFMVVVAHPGGFETLYGHCLPARAVRVGEVVKKGEVIGYMGNTGRSTGVHLHLELRRGRSTLNPLAFL
jgi:murein DD-endopeptidase MepM/ murein hydrolase activator NlpD